MKKKLLAACVVVICLAIMGSSTLAYFTDRAAAHNVITTGGIGIAIIEKTRDEGGILTDFPEEGFSDVMPGTSVSKIVSVKNDGGADAWIRVKVEQTINAPDGTPLPDTLPGDIPVMSFSVDGGKWTPKDGWYYYTGMVEAGTSTDIFFEEVRFAPGMGNEYQNCTANILVYAQAVQADNNGTRSLNAIGWPE